MVAIEQPLVPHRVEGGSSEADGEGLAKVTLLSYD